jgi:hypothetical protein
VPKLGISIWGKDITNSYLEKKQKKAIGPKPLQEGEV